MPRPILSIGMIVKNESTHLKNCLTHLQPIIDALDSELIIADTGSTDDTVVIAKEFATKVIEIKWNDDFSWARNHTIEAATGEWYMFLDADEYFIETGDLIRFFKSGEYKKYKNATYGVRDYQLDGTFRAAMLRRLCVLTPTTRFTGRVHEQLPVEFPSANLNSYVRHYGYVSDENPELSRQKMLRNLPILEKEHKENPTAINPLRYLAYSYMDLGEKDKAFKYMDMLMDIVGKNPDEVMYQTVHSMLAFFHAKDKQPKGMKKAIEVIDKCMETTTIRSLSSIDMYCNKGHYCYLMQEYEKAIEAFTECYQLLQAFFAGTLSMYESGWHIPEHATEQSLWLVVAQLADCYAKLKDYNAAFTWLARASLNEPRTVDSYFSLVNESDQVNRIGELFERIARMRTNKNNIEAMDRCLTRFNEIVLPNDGVVVVLQSFFDIYVEVVYDYLQRAHAKELLTDDSVKSLNSVYQMVYHLHLSDLLRKYNDVVNALKHFESAIMADKRFAVLMEARLNAFGV